jgi:hypothetical protein
LNKWREYVCPVLFTEKLISSAAQTSFLHLFSLFPTSVEGACG